MDGGTRQPHVSAKAAYERIIDGYISHRGLESTRTHIPHS